MSAEDYWTEDHGWDLHVETTACRTQVTAVTPRRRNLNVRKG